jgi:hypothetical protein
VDGVNGDWGGKPFTDLMTGLGTPNSIIPSSTRRGSARWARSYGGYMATLVLGHTDRFKCIVSHDRDVRSRVSLVGTTEELWFNEWEFKGKPWDYYGKPDARIPTARGLP